MDTTSAFTSPLAPVITRYLALKTALGRGYDTERRFLRSLDAFLVAQKASELSLEVFDHWCQTQAHLKSGIRRAQMRIVRNLCLYRRRTEPTCFVPNLAFFPPPHQHELPYLLTEDEVARLIAATATLLTTSASPLRVQAMRLGLVLLYTAGLRRGELLRLTVGDYDPQDHTLLVRASKFHKSRLLPLSADAVEELEDYRSARRAYRPDTTTPDAPLIWKGGAAMRAYSGSGFADVFHTLARRAGILKANGQPPRVHDVRHSFAVHALLRWYRAGVDVQAKLPLLSMYMGHVSIISTQYYLRLVEPVASAASERFAQSYGDLLTPPPKEEQP
jgi:integrase/recombinase XerD